MPAGYSGTPLAKKLGIKPGTRVVALGAPDDYAALLAPLPDGAVIRKRLGKEEAFVHLFAPDTAWLDKRLARAHASLASTGMLWISWPKKASGIATDLDGNQVRTRGLATGLVDIKVCAVDETWSGLKFVVRRADR